MGKREATEFLAAIVSPLPNLGMTAPSSATLVHQVPLTPLDRGTLQGNATLRLAPDRKSLSVTIEASGQDQAQISLVRADGGGAGPGPLVLLISNGGGSANASFDLSDTASLEHGCDLREHGIDPAALGASSIAGITIPAKQPAGEDRLYWRRRMLDEIRAALRSDQTVAASIHVRMATLYARELGGGSTGLSL